MSVANGESLEPHEEIVRSMLALEEIRDWLDDIGELAAPLPGSVLAEEDRLNPYEPGSHLATHFDAVSTDNLRAVADTVLLSDAETKRGVPAFALYSQLRGSIEATAWGYWLLMSHTKGNRLYRALSITYGHAEDFQGSSRSLGFEWPAEARMDRLRQIKDDIPKLRQRELDGPPRTSDMLRAVDKGHVLTEQLTALNAWKLCSGMAHGTRPIVYNLSERRAVSEPDEIGSTRFELLARIGWIAILARVAADLIVATRTRYYELATHDHAGRPI